MSTPASSLERLANIPIDRVLPMVMDKLRHSTLDERARSSAGERRWCRRRTTSRPEKGSKLEIMQNAVVLHAVAVSGGNVSAAARLLGVERKAFERKLARARRSKRG